MREAGSQASRLWVHGPGAESITHEFPDLVECMQHQSEIERKLVAEGFRFKRLGTADADDGREAK